MTIALWRKRLCCLAMVFLLRMSPLSAQEAAVTGHVLMEPSGKSAMASSTVVWLAPQDPGPGSVAPMHAVLQQKNKMFEPHLLVLTTGSTVEFPNRDPWFHNVFSLFNGKKFDLGLYEAGTSRTVHFDREGVSYIFCNIHPEMSAVIVVLASPYFAVPDKQGEFSITNVPAGRYVLHVWSENSQPSALQALAREVQIGETNRNVGAIRVSVSAPAAHKNKYGQEYEPPSPNNPIYAQPR